MVARLFRLILPALSCIVGYAKLHILPGDMEKPSIEYTSAAAAQKQKVVVVGSDEEVKVAEDKANQGHIGSMDVLGKYHFGRASQTEGAEKKSHQKKGIKWTLKAAEAGHAEAQYQAGILYGTGMVPGTNDEYKKNPEKAVDFLKKSAGQGRTEAMVEMASAHLKGTLGLEKSLAKAIDWYRKAGEHGDGKSAQRIADMYVTGNEVLSESVKDAISWYNKGAEAGTPWSTQNLYQVGLMYMEGENVEKDEDTGIEYLEEAGSKGHLPSMIALGRTYHLKKDHKEAMKWYKKAAVLPYKKGEDNFDGGAARGDAALWVGNAHLHGKVAKLDFAVAKTWFHKAAEHNVPEAMFWIGFLLELGKEGVPQNVKESISWLRKAATLNHTNAMVKLGNVYSTGKLIEKDDETALNWYQRALKQNEKSARSMMKKYSNPLSKKILKQDKPQEVTLADLVFDDMKFGNDYEL